MPRDTITKDTNSHSKRSISGTEKLNYIQQILHRDHLKISDMFFQYTQLENSREKEDLVENIIQELFVHSVSEEELVYPIVRAEGPRTKEIKDLMDESETEHHLVKTLLVELISMHPEDQFFDAKVTVLGELVHHHVREEEKNMFVKMTEANIDLEALGEEVLERKEQLRSMSLAEIASELENELAQAKSKHRI